MAALRPLWASPLVPQLYTRAVTAFAVTESRIAGPASLVSSTYLRSAVLLNIPSILSDLWDSVLRAVPKKKTSHMKKRHRQMAGKALKDAKDLNKCSGCGQPKRAHLLCPTCVSEIRQQWRKADKDAGLSTS